MVCQDDAVIEAKANVMVLSLIVGVKYFDFDDYEDPVKGVMDDRIFYNLDSGLQKSVRLFIRKSEVSLIDSILPLAQEDEAEYYSISDTQIDVDTPTNPLDEFFIKVEFLQDPIHDSYERRVYSFLDFSGQLGGFFEILAIVGGFFVNCFVSKFYNYSLFNKLYCVTAQNSDEDLGSKIAPKKMVSTKSLFKRVKKKSNDPISEKNPTSSNINSTLEFAHK